MKFVYKADVDAGLIIFKHQITILEQEATGEKQSTFYLKQRISIAIQRGNAQCIRGCHKKDKDSPDLEGLFNFHVQEA